MANTQGDNLNEEVDEFNLFDELNTDVMVKPPENQIPISAQELIDAQNIDVFRRGVLNNQGSGDNRFVEKKEGLLRRIPP